MERHTTLLFGVLLCSAALGQHEADKWYFGSAGDGLDFTGKCDPSLLHDGAIQGFEGCTTVADRSTGALLFYTNSEDVWGADHQPMPNGHLRPASVTQSQNTITQVLPIPAPGSTDRYYIFTNQIQADFGGFGMRMACVDMTLNNGLGDVVFKDSIVYADPVSEKVTAIRHANGEDLWMIGHDTPGNTFFALLITADGLQYPPVLSHTGKNYTWPEIDCLGEMKPSPDGTKLAVVTSYQPNIELFPFDASTGMVGPPAVIDAVGGYAPFFNGFSNSWWYGVAFSRDGSKLYAGRQNFDNGTPSIVQMDITSTDTAVINASEITISTLRDVYSLHLAPNGKIYTRRIGNFLGVIEHPDSAGPACGFDPMAIDFGHPPGFMDWGFQNNMALAFPPCRDDVQTGISDEASTPTLHPAPIPCGDVLSLRLAAPLDKNGTLDLWDASGALQQRRSWPAWSSDRTLDVSDLPEGCYLIQLLQDDRVIAQERVIVQH